MHADATYDAPTTFSKPAVPAEAAVALLRALGSDDAFRDLFKSDPRKALHEIGFELPVGATTPMCMMVGQLATKEEVRNAYDALYTHLTGATRTAMTVVFTFEHGRINDVVKTAA
ncbi:NHLP-related RiPP peptide [Stenotrophomonas rhizophila]|uniref:NHLP-related RiPP peptide n=1 Tax=Stenotrophomonas rhizophila TaxID=216778 RepID=UPI001E443354|nr:NHLP-related RiPP peptide [Stenotrophomonas rhizophila]MCC7633119.1 NHLP-related RiPP peptide [Stenotrophomonas rhizophila]MCC7662012.1 NHLP-related RiPP peptide [Stenotrophomonas rhizophila]